MFYAACYQLAFIHFISFYLSIFQSAVRSDRHTLLQAFGLSVGFWGILEHFTVKPLIYLIIVLIFNLITYCPMIYTNCYALCFLVAVYHTTRWQDILFCNFWIERWLVRIANVLGCVGWLIFFVRILFIKKTIPIRIFTTYY